MAYVRNMLVFSLVVNIIGWGWARFESIHVLRCSFCFTRFLLIEISIDIPSFLSLVCILDIQTRKYSDQKNINSQFIHDMRPMK
jgi:hypothetical protein